MHVLGAGDRDHVHEDVGTFKASVDPGLDVAPFEVDLRAHRLEATDVHVDRTAADGATTGQ
jgi:hypothetical protein